MTTLDGLTDEDVALGYLDKHDVAKMLKVSTATVRRLTDAGLLPAVHLGPRLVRYDAREVREHLRTRRVEPKTDKAG